MYLEVHIDKNIYSYIWIISFHISLPEENANYLSLRKPGNRLKYFTKLDPKVVHAVLL